MSAAAAPVEARRAGAADALGVGRAAQRLDRSACSGSSSSCSSFTKLIQPNYGVAGVQGLAISVLPLALAAVAQAIVVIVGRDRPVDRLDDGPRPASSPPSLMKGQSEEFGVVGRRRRRSSSGLVLGADQRQPRRR